MNRSARVSRGAELASREPRNRQWLNTFCMSIGADQEWLEFHCENCRGSWFLTPDPARTGEPEPCVYCGEATSPHSSTLGTPQVDLELLSKRLVENQKAQSANHLVRGTLRCPFCETPLVASMNQSKEHVLPRWLRNVDPLPDALKDVIEGRRRWIQDGPEMVGDTLVFPAPRVLRSKPIHELYSTVSVCATCNNEWMSALELEANPHLAPLISGLSDELSVDAHQLLSRWACKVMVALEQDDPASAKATPAQARDVRLGRVSRWTEIFISRWSTPLETMLRHSAFEGRVPNSYKKVFSGSQTYIALGNVCLLVVSTDTPLVDLSAFHANPLWLQIWPSPGASIQLPQYGLDRAKVEAEDDPAD